MAKAKNDTQALRDISTHHLDRAYKAVRQALESVANEAGRGEGPAFDVVHVTDAVMGHVADATWAAVQQAGALGRE